MKIVVKSDILLLGDEREKWLSNPVSARIAEQNGVNSALSTPSTISPTPDIGLDEESTKTTNGSIDYDKTDGLKIVKDYAR